MSHWLCVRSDVVYGRQVKVSLANSLPLSLPSATSAGIQGWQYLRQVARSLHVSIIVTLLCVEHTAVIL